MTSKRGYTSLDDVDPYPRAAYRDRDGRHYSAPGFSARYDSSQAFAKKASPDLPSPPTNALVDLFVATNVRSDGAGVLLLDGEAVASGDGRYQFEVEPGRHRLEVQGYDASSTEFEAAPGERVCLTTAHGVSVRRQTDFRTELYRVRGPEGLVLRSVAGSGMGCLAAILGVLMLGVSGLLMSFFSFGLAAEIVMTVLIGVGFVLIVAGFLTEIRPVRRLHKHAKDLRLDPARRTVPVPGGFGGDAVAFPSPEDAREWARERRVRGVLLVFDLFLYRLTREPGRPAEYSGTGEDLAMAHAEGLRLWIDGAEAPCDWASWHYPLEAGEHVFAVEYGGGETRHEFTVKAKDRDDLTVIQVPVQVFRLWNTRSGRGEALEPRIAHKVQREARSEIGKLNRRPGERDEWVPGRYFPLR